MAADVGIYPVLTLDPNANPEDSQQGRIMGVSIMLIILSTTVVALRFLARRLSKAGLWWDDWFILAALIISWGPCISMLYSVKDGFGKHMSAEGDFPRRKKIAQDWFKNLYAFSTLYTFAITLAKYSILLFYSRIFKERKFLWALKGVFVLVTLWFIAIQVAVFAECVPINALWDPATNGTCIDFAAFYQGSGIPNVVINTIILFLPLPMIWSLEIEKRHKFALSGVFLLGSFVVIVSIIRLVFIAKVEYVDITWTFVDAGIWTAIEPCVAVISASLPILRSLWIWNRRKRSARRATNETSDDEPKIPSYPPAKARPNTKKGNHSSKSSQQYPLNELPSGAQHAWGNSVQIYSQPTSAKTSGDDDFYADLPIMHPGENQAAGRAGSSSRPPLRHQASELYGSTPAPR